MRAAERTQLDVWDRNFFGFCFVLCFLRQGLTINPGWTWTPHPPACYLSSMEIPSLHYHTQWTLAIQQVNRSQQHSAPPTSKVPSSSFLYLLWDVTPLCQNHSHLPEFTGSFWILGFFFASVIFDNFNTTSLLTVMSGYDLHWWLLV